MFRLDHKTAVVTGGASGIGAAIVVRFRAAGARVFLLDRDADKAQQVARVSGAEFFKVDVSDEQSVMEAAESVQGTTSAAIDVLVNNAGIGHVGTLLNTTVADLDRLYAVNVRSVMLMSRAFVPPMLKAGHGSVINLASVGGVVGIRDRLAYCATKFAVNGLTKSMAIDHAGTGVRFNAICPGRVETPFVSARLKESADPVLARTEMVSTQPLGRMAEPEEIAAAAHYLASDESAFVTGSEFLIDGGWTAGK